jgi:hypothetical protein
MYGTAFPRWYDGQNWLRRSERDKRIDGATSPLSTSVIARIFARRLA